MHYPAVGERVWVSGCSDEFIVKHADYLSSLAIVARVADQQTVSVPFRLLFASLDAAEAGGASPAVVRDILRSSALCLRHSDAHIRELREIMQATLASIQKSHALIAESDRAIERCRKLGAREPKRE